MSRFSVFVLGLAIIASTLSLPLGSLSLVQPTTTQIDQLWQEANKAYSEGKYPLVLEITERILATNPQHAASLNTRGCAFHSLGRYPEAVQVFDLAISQEPENATFISNRGRTRYQLRRYDEALRDFDKAITLEPKRALHFESRALVFVDTSRYDRAIADFDSVLAIEPKNAVALANKANSLRLLGRFPESLVAAEEAVQIDPKRPQAVRERFRTLLAMGRLEQAGKVMDDLVRIAPDDVMTHYDRGRYLEATDRPEEALRAYAEAEKLNPKFSAIFRRRAELQRELGRADEAGRDERRYEELTGRGYTTFTDLAPLPAPTGGPIFEGWHKDTFETSEWPAKDVPWRRDEPPLKPDDLPEETAGLDLEEYRAMASEALELVRIVYGDLTEDESMRLQAKWAPVLETPTHEGLAYFRQLNPLLNRFLRLRAAIAMAAADFDQSWERAGFAAGLGLANETAEQMRQCDTIRATLVGLRDELAKVVEQIKKLGDPPNPYRARKRARDAFNRAIGKPSAAPPSSGLTGIWEGTYLVEDEAGSAARPFLCAILLPPQGMAVQKDRLMVVSMFGPYIGYYQRFSVRWLYNIEESPGVYKPGPSDTLFMGDLVKSVRVEGANLTIVTEFQEPKSKLTYRLRRISEPMGPGPEKSTLADAIALRKRAKVLDSTPPPKTGDEIADMRAVGDRHRLVMNLTSEAFVLENYHQTRYALPLALKGFTAKPSDFIEALEKRVGEVMKDATALFEQAKQQAETASPTEAAVLTPAQVNATQIAETRSRIVEAQKRLEKWKAELASAKDPKQVEQLRLNVVATITDIQEQEALVKSLETGEIVQTRTLWQQLDHTRFVEKMQMEARAPTLYSRAEKQLDGLIGLLEGKERDEMLAMKDKALDPTTRVQMDTEKLRQLFRAAHNKVLGQQGAAEVYNDEWINSLEEVKFGAGLALVVVSPYAAVSSSPYAGYAGWIGAGYGIGTGYVEGGVVGAAESGLRMVSATVDVTLAALQGYNATGSWTEAGKAGLLQFVLRKGLELSSQRLVQERLRALQPKLTWQEAVQKYRFNELKENEGRVLREQYRSAAAEFEAMVAKRAGSQDRSAYLKQHAAELAATPEGKRLLDAMGAVENSYTTKLVMNETGDKGLIRGYNEHVGTLMEQPVISTTQRLMKLLGYNEFKMGSIRHGANKNKVGMDHDLAVAEDGWTPTRNGQPITMLEFQRDLARCLGKAYKEVTGRSAEHADWRGTTRVDPEAYLDRAVLDINRMREMGLSPAQILRALNPQTADQTAGVNVYKTQKALGRSGAEGIAEACRTLTKELDTKVLPTLPKGSFELQMFQRLRDVLSQGTSDPMGVQQKVRMVTGRDLNQVAQMLAARFRISILGGG
ncbi:MAG TPA: tetratricopeptide repeat protein [Fimbriimonadaceae bacterium]|nr:tetratricopeptide repeat protein [Fimbriimonadaceae bacterium]HRJ96487.1 tetratricopeptide repeat protein [Fimbriimonadaceae bacterium]